MRQALRDIPEVTLPRGAFMRLSLRDGLPILASGSGDDTSAKPLI
jgi:hypothetical protein